VVSQDIDDSETSVLYLMISCQGREAHYRKRQGARVMHRWRNTGAGHTPGKRQNTAPHTLGRKECDGAICWKRKIGAWPWSPVRPPGRARPGPPRCHWTGTPAQGNKIQGQTWSAPPRGSTAPAP